MKTFPRILRHKKSRSRKSEEDTYWVVKITGDMKSGYQKFHMNFQISPATDKARMTCHEDTLSYYFTYKQNNFAR